MGVAAIGNCRCCSRNVGTGSLVDRCSPFWVEAHRSSASQNELSLSLRLPYKTKFLASEEGDIHPPRVCNLSRFGAARKQESADNGYVITITGAKVGVAYVEDHYSRFHVAGSPDHGCNEYCIRPDSDRPKRANDRHSLAHRDSTDSSRFVMAKVIEFYIPRSFRKSLRAVAQPQLGKIIE